MPIPPPTASPVGRMVRWVGSPAGLALIIGILLSCLVYWRLNEEAKQRLQHALDRAADNRIAALHNAIRSYTDFLAGFQLLFTHSDRVTLQEFEGATEAALADYPGLSGIEWARFTRQEELPDLQNELRAMGLPPLELKRRLPDNTTIPLAPRDFMLPVIYAVPYSVHHAAYGLDLTSGISAAREILRSVHTARMVMSPVSKLLVEHEPMGFVVFIPVYTPAAAGRNATDDQHLRGCLVGIFRLDKFLDHLSESPQPGLASLELRDATARRPQDFAFRVSPTGELSPLVDTASPAPRKWQKLTAPQRELRLWERTWSVKFLPDYAWLDAQDGRRNELILALCLFVAFAFSRIMHSQKSRYALVEQAVRERTAELSRNRATLDAIIDHNPNSIWCKDTAGRFILVNRVFCALYGCDRAQLLGRTDREIYPSEDVANFEAQDARVLAGDELPRFEGTYTIHGEQRTFLVVKFPLHDADGTPFAVAGISTDITALRHAERETLAIERKLLEAQKPESLGVLAGGIAHDFNNLLTGVLGNAGLLATLLPPGTEARTRVRNIERAATRAAELCRQMLAYAGRGRFVEESVDLASLTRDILPLLEMSIGRTADFTVAADGPVRRVMADPSQIRQILMNLVINASEALPETGGRIAVRVFDRVVTAAETAGAMVGREAPPGPYICWEIVDTGCGMTQETITRIFDPFFTTKFTGRGLGLAAVGGIVRSHRGVLIVSSTPGHGSTFRFLLPAADPPGALNLEEIPPAVPAAPATPSVTHRLLIADDEADVRDIVAQILRTKGFVVHTAVDGSDALARFTAAPHNIDLVVLDLTMPGLDGLRTLAAMRKLRPVLPAVMMSGYSQTLDFEAAKQAGPTVFLNKPFDVELLRAEVRRLLTTPA